MAATLYGIPNCDTVKKARTWLENNGIDYTFHDFKKAGLTADLAEGWLKQVEWNVIVNRKGTTWRALSDERKTAVADAKSAAELMLESPSVIKRPVLSYNGSTHIGFSDVLYQQIFNK
jgi:arsenate reductase (glutaredoxin)